MAAFDDSSGLSAYKDWNSAVNTFWTFFSGAALGIAGLAAKSGAPGLFNESGSFNSSRLILLAAFVIFAAGNNVVLYRAQTIFAATAAALRERAQAPNTEIPKAYQAVFNAAKASSPMSVRCFQIFLSICTGLAILYLPKA